MNLKRARLCLDCGEIHDHDFCPVCVSYQWFYLSEWVRPIEAEDAA